MGLSWITSTTHTFVGKTIWQLSYHPSSSWNAQRTSSSLDVQTRNEALLALLLIYQVNLLCISLLVIALAAVITVLLDFGICLSTLKPSTKTEILDCRRTEFSLHRGQLGRIPWEASTDNKGTKLGCFKHALLEVKNQLIPL